MSDLPIQLSDCWAKTDRATGRPVLSVLDHSLIVGTVAEVLATLLPGVVRHHLPSGGITLIAGHDVGKITAGFLCKAPGWKLQWMPQGHGLDATTDHTRAGACHFEAVLTELGAATWAKAVGGHHGRYSSRGKLIEPESAHFKRLRDELLAALVARFGPLPAHSKPSDTMLHWFTGMMILADWIGSDEQSFVPNRLPKDLVAVASQVISGIGLGRHTTIRQRSFSDLFRKPGQPDFLPNALQQTLLHSVEGPGLYIVEAEMGGGKTEAVLAASHQLWQGREAGLYFALPTRLTSERIHSRLRDFLHNISANDTRLSLVHGTAWLSEDRILKVLPAGREDARDTEQEAFSWFASSKRALLAPYGAGTIDQALTATLGVKHSALRLFALGGKTVIFDEVHSYDAYTFGLLCELVGRLRELGGSVFILSATLTHARRRQLLEAAGGIEATSPEAYPLITTLFAGTGTAVHRVPEVCSPVKTIHLEKITPHDPRLWQRFIDAAEAGACVLIVRNTVKLAQETYLALKHTAREGAAPIGLLHSRFTQSDRAALEKQWIGRLGRTSQDRPAGCLLVSSQIVEQSVDLDADYLVTDLAPTDLLLQRIGRLHRHSRPRPTGFEGARALILYPEVDIHLPAKEIIAQLGPSAWVYPPYVLLRSAEIWRARTTLLLPGEIRSMLEETHRDREETTKSMIGFRQDVFDSDKEMRRTARGCGHPLSSEGPDDPNDLRTRWNQQKSATLVLLAKAPINAGGITTLQFPDGEEIAFPTFEFSLPLAKALHHRSVQLPLYLVKSWLGSSPAWLLRHVQGAVVVGVLNYNREVLRADKSPAIDALLHYHADVGLRYERIRAAVPDWHEDDGWW